MLEIENGPKEAAVMKQQARRQKPELDQSKNAVLNGLGSSQSRHSYRHAVEEARLRSIEYRAPQSGAGRRYAAFQRGKAVRAGSHRIDAAGVSPFSVRSATTAFRVTINDRIAVADPRPPQRVS
jgi:hypothetical protein